MNNSTKNRIILFCIVLFLLPTCKQTIYGSERPTPEIPPIALERLLLKPEELGDGWVSYSPFTSRDEICYYDCITIQFDAKVGEQTRVTHHVYFYETAEDAKDIYEELLIHTLVGETPSDWEYQSKFAQRSDFKCYTYVNIPYPSCGWTALYDRYTVALYVWLAPGVMTFEELENLIKIIDQRMSMVYHQSGR